MTSQTSKTCPTATALTPCINVCAIDATSGMCTGCLRTLDEIAIWGSLSNDQRRTIMETLPARAVCSIVRDNHLYR